LELTHQVFGTHSVVANDFPPQANTWVCTIVPEWLGKIKHALSACLQTLHCKGYALALNTILHTAGRQFAVFALEGNTAKVIDESSALPLTLC
jgi:hypothetical protein